MTVSTTRMRRVLAAGAVLALGASVLAGCSADGKETVRFAFSKREAFEIVREMVSTYNAQSDDVRVILDTSGVDTTSAGFVRGNPPDISLANYNMETSRFVERCALTDLSDTEAAQTIREDLSVLMDQYGSCEDRTSALPYSIMASSVVYNMDIFEEVGVEVPTTWDELIEVCETLADADVTPFYGTFKDPWTIGQGWYDYAVGGSIDVVGFYEALDEEGTEVGPDSEVSFEKDHLEPVERMMELASTYTNPDAGSIGYNDGNTAFVNGDAAMYLQGPWAISELLRAEDPPRIGTFPLPMTDDPDDLKVRVNVDLAAWIPVDSRHQEAARDFLEFLFLPENIEAYNESQLGFTPTEDAPPPSQPEVEGMVPFYEDGRYYQGPSVLVPQTIPFFNYTQAIALGDDPAQVLRTIDADWARLAFRQ
ncbi:ABC transporter substrate-binding protein [Microbacterium sp. 179-B 1A2 NHS]|uniref:ABC transporter substrate-binding protein n=1 Tax=Microbacterium sp. 179-B 1A2 NHS TaxID=3142383 RepID=UPI00399EF1E1